MVIIDIESNTSVGGLTLDPAGMHCPSWDDAFVSSSIFISLDTTPINLVSSANFSN